mmetsp:Transcript_112388/g.205909  ORF Transcript_112388/g.205909 Transcript_112388/m.205909 type:complete len:265 (-) Transcript_112388:96-890(-)
MTSSASVPLGLSQSAGTFLQMSGSSRSMSSRLQVGHTVHARTGSAISTASRFTTPPSSSATDKGTNMSPRTSLHSSVQNASPRNSLSPSHCRTPSFSSANQHSQSLSNTNQHSQSFTTANQHSQSFSSQHCRAELTHSLTQSLKSVATVSGPLDGSTRWLTPGCSSAPVQPPPRVVPPSPVTPMAPVSSPKSLPIVSRVVASPPVPFRGASLVSSPVASPQMSPALLSPRVITPTATSSAHILYQSGSKPRNANSIPWASAPLR